MRFYEYEAKALFRQHGLPLGRGELVARENAAEGARAAFAKLGGGPVVLKSQVLSGGRMKALFVYSSALSRPKAGPTAGQILQQASRNTTSSSVCSALRFVDD